MRHYSTYQSQFIEMFWDGKYTMKKLRGHIEVLRGVSYEPSDVHEDLSDNTSIVLRSNNIDGGQVNFDDLVYVDSERVSEHQVLNAGDIVMCGSNGSKKLVGKAALLNETPRENTSFGAFCLGIRCKSSIIPEYLATYFQTSLYRDKIEALGSGSNILNIKPDHIYDLEIPIPSLGEQEAFVSIVKQADKSKFTSLKSQFIEMFEGDKYLKTRLGDFVSIRTGKLDANASSENGKYPFFTCGVETLKIDDYAFDCEAVLLAGNGEFCVKYYNGKFNAYQRTYVIETLDNNVISVPYLYAWFGQYAKVLRGKAIGGIIKYIKMGDLTEAKISFPPLEVQNRYVAIAQQADKSKYMN